MLFLENIYIEMIIISICLCWISFFGLVIFSRAGMKKNEKTLRKMNVIPAGSMVSHGMVVDEKRGIGVIRDSEPSENWFKRLL